MPTRRRMRFVRWQLAWMLAAVFLVALLGSVSFALFLAVSLFGLLVVTELTAPVNVAPRWRSRLRRLVVAGLIGFGVLVLVRLETILPVGVIP